MAYTNIFQCLPSTTHEKNMKFIIIAALIGLCALSVISAAPLGVSAISRRQDTCPLDVLSCSWSPSQGERCCSPEYGLMVLVQQWDTSVPPRNEFTMHGLWPDTCDGKQVPIDSNRPMQKSPKCPDSEPVQGCDDDRVYFVSLVHSVICYRFFSPASYSK